MLCLVREISVRHLVRAPLRSLLVVCGIALGVALYVAIDATTDAMFNAFKDMVQRVGGRADLTIRAAGSGIPGERLADVAAVPGVSHAAASLETVVQAPDLRETLLVLGVDLLGDLHFLPFSVERGNTRVIDDPLAFVNDPTALLISGHFARRHGLSKGSVVRLLTADGVRPFHVEGILADNGPAAFFGGQVAVMFLDAAQISFARGTSVDRIDVALDPGADITTVEHALTKLGSALNVERPSSVGARLRDLTEPLRGMLWLSGFLALLVGAFLVYNAVGVAVVQRRREIGVLRAIGTSRSATVALFCLEVTVLAFPAIVLGLCLGRSLSRLASAQALDTVGSLYASVGSVQPEMTLSLALRGTLVGLVTALGGAFLPARRGAAVDPIATLRGSAVATARVPHVRLLVAGVGCLGVIWLPALRGTLIGGAVALTVLVLGVALSTPAIILLIRRIVVRIVERAAGVPGRLGLDYVQRTLGRSTVNVLALMVAASLSVSIGGWITSFERSLTAWFEQVTTADFTVTAGSPILDHRHTPMSAHTLSVIAATPGVVGVQPFRIIDQVVSGKTIRLVATDSDLFLSEAGRRGKGWTLVEGAPVRVGELSTNSSLLLSEGAAHRLGLHAGNHVVLHTPRGDVNFLVRGIVVDYTSERGAAFIDERQYIAHWGEDSVDAVSAYVARGEGPDVVVNRVRAALGDDGAFFVTKSEALRASLVDSVRQSFSYSRAVELVTLVIALMGVIGTLAAAVMDRIREIGVMRAVGAMSGQVAVAIVVEACFLGFCAILVGTILGALECHLFLKTLVLTDIGWHLDFVFPWGSAARVGLAVLVTSALAAAIPAARAARVDVNRALLYE
jgi:putative ABC transport system permease protein